MLFRSIAWLAPTKRLNSARFAPTNSPRGRFPRTNRPVMLVPGVWGLPVCNPGIFPSCIPFGPICPVPGAVLLNEPTPSRFPGDVCWIFPGVLPTARLPISCASANFAIGIRAKHIRNLLTRIGLSTINPSIVRFLKCSGFIGSTSRAQ